MTLLPLLACAPPTNQPRYTANSPMDIGTVHTVLWWEPDPDGAALYVSPAVFDSAALRGQVTNDVVFSEPLLSAWFDPVEDGTYAGTFRSGLYPWPELWATGGQELGSSFWAIFGVDGGGIDATGGLGLAVLEQPGATEARGNVSTAYFELAFAAEVCEPGIAESCEPTEEVCNGVDDDCDDDIDEGLTASLYRDEDGDGHGAGEPEVVCAGAEHYAELGDDCDDGDPGVFPGNVEQCNAVDDDCDAYVDEQAC